MDKNGEDIEELSIFLAEYAAALLSSGAYTSRVSRCTERLVQVMDMMYL